MSTGEILFLFMVVATAGAFAATLVYYSRG